MNRELNRLLARSFLQLTGILFPINIYNERVNIGKHCFTIFSPEPISVRFTTKNNKCRVRQLLVKNWNFFRQMVT